MRIITGPKINAITTARNQSIIIIKIQIIKIVIISVIIPNVFMRISENTILAPVVIFLAIMEMFVFT